VAWDIVYGISLAGACLAGWVFGWVGAKVRYTRTGSSWQDAEDGGDRDGGR
jgi:hypothetical protein